MNIKGFDKNLKCRGVQFEIGKEYKIDTGRPLELCTDTVFHYCKSMWNVHQYYNVEESRFCEIEVLGEEVTDGEKCGSNHIKILREIKGEELDILIGRVNGNTGLFNSGDRNSGDWNSGDFNSCKYSSGIFCNRQEESIRIFNQPSGMTHQEFYNSPYYRAIWSAPFNLTERVEGESKTEGGHLKTYSYKEACANWWDAMADENKEIIKSMPNFDADVFEDITGIHVEDGEKPC